MKRLLVAISLLVSACAAAVASDASTAPSAAAATTVVSFDDLPANTALATQYSSRGITFAGAGATVLGNTGMARSDPNLIVCRANPEFCSGPVTADLSPPQSRVRVWVGHFNTQQATITLRAYDSAGAVVGSASRFFSVSRASTPVDFALEVSVATPIIARIDVDSDDFDENTAIDDIEFQRPDPVVTLNPSCRGSTEQTLTVSASNFTPNSRGYVTFDPEGPEQQSRIRIPIDAAGSFSAQFATTTSGRGVTIDVNDLDGVFATVRWERCPPPGATTTSTTTTVADSVPDDTTTTSTTRPSGGGGPTTTAPSSTTIPTIVEIPPPTPGAALIVTPSLGPGGFVTTALGSGFPANQPVTLGWSPGIGIYSATARPDGTFTSSVLIMNRDVLGPRTLVATSGGVSAIASFLVVPSTVQPSGKDVAQITRVRRFLQR